MNFTRNSLKIRESFCESGEGVRLPRERADLRPKSGKLPGKSGELPGKSGKLPGNPWIAVKFHSVRTSGEVAEKLPGKFGELPGKSGDFPEARGSLTPSQRLANLSPRKCRRYKGAQDCFKIMKEEFSGNGFRKNSASDGKNS